MGTYILPHLGYYSDELVLRNKATTWNHKVGRYEGIFFFLTFSFGDGFECIDESLQEIKVAIFIAPVEPITWVQPDWSTQLCHALKCYNVTIEEGEEDPKNISIPKLEGQCEVVGPKVEVLDISKPLKTNKVNIGSEAQPKFTNIGDYWDEGTFDKVTTLLHEYQDLFPTKFSDLKWIVDDLGLIKVNLKPDAKMVKQRPY